MSTMASCKLLLLRTARNYTLRTASLRSSQVLSTPHSLFYTHDNHFSYQFQQCREHRVFVSKHNQSLALSSRNIVDYLQNHSIETSGVRSTASHVILRECPFCNKPTQSKADNLYKCYIQLGGGAYFCHRCGAAGSWFDLKHQLGGGGGAGGGTGTSMMTARSATQSTAKLSSSHDVNDLLTDPYRGQSNKTIPCLPMPSPRLQAIYSTNLLHKTTDNPVLDYLTQQRGLLSKTLHKYGVGKGSYKFANDSGGWTETECVTFSWMSSVKDVEVQEELRGAKYVASDLENVDPKDMEEAKTNTYVTRRIKARALCNKAWQRLDPPGGAWGFFGYHTVPKGATEVVITEGEYDAMAVWQATGRTAISLPNGCRSLPVETLPMLEDFEKIYLWMDNDGPGQEGAELFAKKIGLERCYLVRPTQANTGSDKLPKDANEALLQGLNLENIIKEAKLTPHEKILDFDDLRADVLHEILHPDKYIGVPILSLPGFTRIIKGLRRGELTVLTGPTGSGKTTFLGQMSLDLAEQGVNVLWGSFEIKNTRLVHKLLQQFARKPLPTGDPSLSPVLEALADRFGQLPLNFLKFHGGTDVDDVLDAMEYATYVNDCQHIILDNMQFMISRQNASNSWDKFDVQDVAIEKFRRFATDRNVHITLVVHPRKEQETSRLSISSIYGSAKATQEADTVVIIQDDGNRKFLDVRKNRFNGDLGSSPLHFDRKSGRYQEDPVINVNTLPKLHVPRGSSTTSPAPGSLMDRLASPMEII